MRYKHYWLHSYFYFNYTLIFVWRHYIKLIGQNWKGNVLLHLLSFLFSSIGSICFDLCTSIQQLRWFISQYSYIWMKAVRLNGVDCTIDLGLIHGWFNPITLHIPYLYIIYGSCEYISPPLHNTAYMYILVLFNVFIAIDI